MIDVDEQNTLSRALELNLTRAASLLLFFFLYIGELKMYSCAFLYIEVKRILIAKL